MHDAPTILVIENDEEAYRCVSAALRSVAPAPRVAWACGAADAAAYLEGQDGYADRTFFPLPDVVLLDLKTPAETELEFVRWLRSRSGFRSLPVLALSTGGDEFDAARAAEAGVTAFFHVPCDAARLAELFAGVVAHWRAAGSSRFCPWPGAVALPVQSCAA
jgi:CheY-like chemotaxis protein